MKYKIHPLADVQTKQIGENTFIWQFCVVLSEAKIGANCNICSHCLIENKVILGNNVTIKSGVQIWDGVTLQDNVFVGPNVTFTNDIVPKSKVYPTEFKKTIVQKGASIGANSTLIAGITIGENAFIGAGSVVTKNIPANTIWYGNPATHKGYITDDAILLDMKLIDNITKTQFTFENERLIRK